MAPRFYRVQIPLFSPRCRPQVGHRSRAAFQRGFRATAALLGTASRREIWWGEELSCLGLLSNRGKRFHSSQQTSPQGSFGHPNPLLDKGPPRLPCVNHSLPESQSKIGDLPTWKEDVAVVGNTCVCLSVMKRQCKTTHAVNSPEGKPLVLVSLNEIAGKYTAFLASEATRWAFTAISMQLAAGFS